jgi:flagellin
MADIALSQGVRQNLLAMQKTVDLMARTQNRLATGKKVNSALDNPTSYFVSAGLENRANDLSRLLDSMGLGIKTLEAADNGIKALKKLIETAQATARQALQAASSTPKVTSSAQNISGGTALTSLGIGFDVADTIQVTVNGQAGTAIAVGTLTLDGLAAEIDADANLKDTLGRPLVRASVENGRLIVESLKGDDIEVTAAGSATAVAGAAKLFGVPTSTSGGSPATSATYTVPESFYAIRTSLAEQYEGLKAQMDQLIKDTGYNGVNLLNGDVLKVLFNENNTTFTDIEGVVFDSAGLGLSQLINGDSADTPFDWQSDSEIKAALDKLDTALNRVRAQASNFGSHLIVLQTRQDFTKQSIATLNGGSDLLVLADVSEEGANLLALQTRQQLSTQALSLSAQTDQAVLRLFG